jgi:TolA-binding protein
MKSKIFMFAGLIAAAGLISAGFTQQSAEQLYQSAIYKQDVEGKLEEAIALYREIIKRFPGEREIAAKALLHIGICYEKLGRTQAADAFRAVVEKYADQTETVRLARERLSLLTRAENQAQAEVESQAEGHLDKGNELFKRWDYESAVREYEKAIKLRPNTFMAMNAQYCIGQAWYRAGKYDIALKTLTDLVAEHPDSSIAPVTELMISQVRYAMQEAPNPATSTIKSRGDALVDPETGITFRKVKTLTGESDIITYANSLNLSPNGKFLLSENTVVPMDGSSPFELVDFRETGIQATRATWSPDGAKAAFYSGDALCVVPVSPETGRPTGPHKKIQKTPLRWQSNPGWSPDGNKLTYYTKGDLWAIDSDGTNLKRLTTTQDTREIGPVWSPDGKTIAYGTTGRNTIGLYDVENATFSELAEIGYRCFPAWSPDGNWIIGNWDKLYFYSRDHKAEFEYSPPKEVGVYFSCQEDGRMFFFHGSYFGNTGLRITSSEGGPSFEPVHLLTNWGTPRWSKDGKLIGVQGEDEDGNIAMRIVPLAGGGSYVIDLDNLVEGKSFPFTFSSDLGKLLFKVERGDGKEDLFCVSISPEEARTKGPAVKIFDGWRREGAFNTVISLSPDGEKAALIHEGDIWIAFTNGDDPVRIPHKAGYLRWAHNGKALLLNESGWSLLENPGPQDRLIKLLDDGKRVECRWNRIDISPDNSRFAVISGNQIRIIPLGEKGSTRILDIGEFKDCGSIKWSPDGQNLAFVGMKETDDPVHFPDGIPHIYKISLDGGKPVRVASDDDDYKEELSWSPDGKWLAYSVERTVKVRPESTIWAAELDDIIKKQ